MIRDFGLCPCGTRYIDPPSKNRSCAKPYLHVGPEGLRTDSVAKDVVERGAVTTLGSDVPVSAGLLGVTNGLDAVRQEELTLTQNAPTTSPTDDLQDLLPSTGSNSLEADTDISAGTEREFLSTGSYRPVPAGVPLEGSDD